MPPGQSFSRDDVIEAAMELIQSHGLSSVTARGVAEKLGSSVAPVYRQFSSMEELLEEIARRVLALLVDYSRRTWSEHTFLNMGTGIAMFAVDYPNLYRALFLDRERLQGVVAEFSQSLGEDLGEYKSFESLPDQVRGNLLETMWMFTHGLASLIAVGLSEKRDLESIIQFLGKTGGAVITAAYMEAGLPLEEAFKKANGADHEGDTSGKSHCVSDQQ